MTNEEMIATLKYMHQFDHDEFLLCIIERIELLAAQVAADMRPRSGAHHIKRRSNYFVFGEGQVQSKLPIVEDDKLVIYRATEGGQIWLRSPAEFNDGRFENTLIPIVKTIA